MPGYTIGRPGLANPTVNDPRVSHELRRFREDAGIPGETVARAIGCSPSKISRAERGTASLSRRSLEQILEYYASHGMEAGHARSIRAMFEEALTAARLLHPALGPAVTARTVREWAPACVPRLLQVNAYATAVLTDMQSVTQTSPGEIREITTAIGRWQGRLAEDPPVRVRALLDEAVLYRTAGGPDVMREQLAHLAEVSGGLAAEGSDIEIRVLPFTASRVPRHVPAFAHLEYDSGDGLEAATGIVTGELEGPAIPALAEQQEWRRFLLFGQLWDAADEAGPAVKRALDTAWA